MASRSTKEEKMYLRIRNLCGQLGVILPWLALVGVLVPACIVLISYIGYDWTDNLITSLAGIFGLGIVLFPCSVSWLPPETPVGFFQLPMSVSNTIHTVCAALFFLAIAFNSLFQFTKHGETMTEKKKLRNRIYRFCGYGMLVLMLIFVVARLLKAPGWTVMIVEILLLHLFGFAWLVKGGAFPMFNDETPAVKTEKETS